MFRKELNNFYKKIEIKYILGYLSNYNEINQKMSLYICKNPNHIHSTLVPPTECCGHYTFTNFIAYSPRPIPINFEKIKFEKKQITKINEEIDNVCN